MSAPPLLTSDPDTGRCELHSPTAMPRASGYLWNRRMLVQVNCRGFVNALHMQPEPGRYAYGPNLEARTFMQPEQPYYAHHPGRFVYLRDQGSGRLFSVPYEPVRHLPERFVFSVGRHKIAWRIRELGISVHWSLQLPIDDVVELWTLIVRNDSGVARRLDLYPYFPIGYMSWMNQSACYRDDLGGVLARCVTPYQKLEDYPRIKTLKDLTFLLHERPPVAWECARETFEGEGGLHAPDALQRPELGNGDARYETPVAALQYRFELADGETSQLRFLFGPARDDAEVRALRQRYFEDDAFARSARACQAYLADGEGVLSIQTPDPTLDDFVNHWLGRQVFYHGDSNRFTTDPQTRNFLQDHMGMSYIRPAEARQSFVLALTQQGADGAMPDGILLHHEAELKFINQTPHSDHCVWLPICLQAYLDETGDEALLHVPVRSDNDGSERTVFDRVTAALRWLINDRDERGLSRIAQGDWCDPMNMVGPLGRGVSGWLSVATVYGLRVWAEVADRIDQAEVAAELRTVAEETGDAVQRHLWDGDWFARGITDAGTVFGCRSDAEGRIFLNPQSFALLAGIARPDQQQRMLAAVEQQLETPFGPALCAPAYTRMREDIGRVTQKHPGSAENGSVYNHAAMFYVYSLYRIGEHDRAFRLLRQAIPGPDRDDLVRRGQLPVFVPNYYRGDPERFPRTAGRSSQLLHTGTAAWMYRSLIEGLFGTCGCPEGLRITPRLPSHWPRARIRRRFRGAWFDIDYQRGERESIVVDGIELGRPVVTAIEPSRTYAVTVTVADRTDTVDP